MTERCAIHSMDDQACRACGLALWYICKCGYETRGGIQMCIHLSGYKFDKTHDWKSIDWREPEDSI